MNRLTASALTAVLLATLTMSAFAAGGYIYVANAGEDTVSKIDIISNTEVARYATWFNAGTNNLIAAHTGNPWAGPAPSRIAKDSAGNVYVLNRFFNKTIPGNGSTNPPHLPVLLKIAPSGNPTSTGSTPLAITDTTNNNDIDIPNEAADRCLVWAKPIGGSGDTSGVGRAVGIDTSGVLWVGMFFTQRYYKVDATTGLTLNPSSPIQMPSGSNHRPYGCQVDKNGKLWSVDENDSVDNELAEINTSNGQVTIHKIGAPHVMYSLSVFNGCGSEPVKVYLSDRSLSSPTTYRVYDPQTSSFSSPALPANLKFSSLSVAVDSLGNIISGQQGSSGRVIKTSPTGAKIWDTTDPGKGPTQSVTDLRGIIVDANDDVWVVDRANTGRVIKYSGANGTYTGHTILIGNQPYTYGNPPPPTCASPTPTPTPTPAISPTPTPTPTPVGCAEVSGEARCLPDGSYSYTFTVKNNSGNPASQILLTPVQGSTFTLAPQLTNLSTPLQTGQSTSITTTIGHANPGDEVCFFVSLMSEKSQCCIVEVCLTLPNCGDVTPTPTPTSTVILPPPGRQAPKGRRRP